MADLQQREVRVGLEVREAMLGGKAVAVPAALVGLIVTSREAELSIALQRKVAVRSCSTSTETVSR